MNPPRGFRRSRPASSGRFRRGAAGRSPRRRRGDRRHDRRYCRLSRRPHGQRRQNVRAAAPHDRHDPPVAGPAQSLPGAASRRGQLLGRAHQRLHAEAHRRRPWRQAAGRRRGRVRQYRPGTARDPRLRRHLRHRLGRPDRLGRIRLGRAPPHAPGRPPHCLARRRALRRADRAQGLHAVGGDPLLYRVFEKRPHRVLCPLLAWPPALALGGGAARRRTAPGLAHAGDELRRAHRRPCRAAARRCPGRGTRRAGLVAGAALRSRPARLCRKLRALFSQGPGEAAAPHPRRPVARRLVDRAGGRGRDPHRP